MSTEIIPFATQSYRHDALPLSSQRCINAFAEGQPRDAKSTVAVFGVQGTSTFATLGNGPIRGMFSMGGVGYAVSGSQFYSFNSVGTGSLLGGGIAGTGVVSIDGNGTQIEIVNGTQGFIWNTSTVAWAQITDANFQTSNTVAFIDSYFALDWANTRKIYLSALLDGTSYPALSFATKESKPDYVLAVRNRQNALLVFAQTTIELWTDTGATAFPFQRFDGGTVNRGIIAPHAIAEEDNSVFFLGDDLIFYRLNGIQPVRVSTFALERVWAKYAVTSDAFAFAVSDRGHKIIYLTFPSAGSTFGFDIATGLWHERMSYDATGAEVKWRANCSLNIFSKTLIGDANSGQIGLLDPTVYTEFGDPIKTVLVSPPLHGNGKKVFMDRLSIDMETGVGIASGQGSNPQVMLDWSDDGGRNFVGPELWSSMGAIGAYRTRVQWDGLGSFYERTLRLRISDPVRRSVIAARADLRLGTGV